MGTNGLKDRSVEQLDSDLLDLLKAQLGLCMQSATGQLSRSNELKCTRHDITRIEAILTEEGAK